MASPTKRQKIESSVCMISNNPTESTKYKNIHCSEACSKLYLQEEAADVHFVFQMGDDHQRLPAHKFILGIGSPVFYSMFYGSLHEGGDINIIDATFDGFKKFLQFFYLDNVTMALKYVDEMMYLADKYDVTECFNVCETFLKEKLPIENICYVLQLAVTFNRSEFVAFLLAKISEKPMEIFASNSFKECSSSILKLILELDNLACDEKAVFDACMAWSEKACEKNNIDPLVMENRREQLGDCFHLIKFDVMKPAHVSDCISECDGLFSRDELLKIMVMRSFDNCINFHNRSRHSKKIIRKWNENGILTISCMYGENTYYVSQAEGTVFKTNKKLLLGAVATPPINPRTREKTELSGVMKIIYFTPENRKIMLEQPVDLVLGGKFEPRNIIKLIQPIDVEPDKCYQIRFDFGSSWCEKVYLTKKIKAMQAQSFGDCRIEFGRDKYWNGIVSHLYFN